jgi:16S rRNA G966 N2-methylase RsmD
MAKLPEKYRELINVEWAKPSVLSNSVLQIIPLDKFNYSEKIDGVHTYLLIFDGKIYDVTNNKKNFSNIYQINKFNFKEMKFSGDCIIETEYYENKYYIFDVYYLNGVDYSEKFLHERLNSINEYLDELGPSFKIKKFYEITDINELLEYIKKDKSPEGNNIDGIILQRIDKPYFQQGYDFNSYKLKPLHLNTVDFLLKYNRALNYFELYLQGYYEKDYKQNMKKLPKDKDIYSLNNFEKPINKRYYYLYQNKKILIYFDSPFYPNLGKLILTENWNKQGYSPDQIEQINDLVKKMKRKPYDYNNAIVELSLTNDKKWVPFRERRDKIFPNSYRVGLSNVSVIFDPIKPSESIYFQKDLTMSEEKLDIIHKINQTYRKYIIETYIKGKNSSIIDLCGGRGADEFNLYSNGVSNFFVIDNDTTALKRYFDRTFNINNKKYESLTTNNNQKSNWININFLKHKLDKNYDEILQDLNARYEFYKREVDIVLMNYAIHYLCDDVDKIKQLGQFVKKVLSKNGIFLITYYDGDEIMKTMKDNTTRLGPFDIKIIKQEKDVTVAKMPMPTIKGGKDIYAEEPLVKKQTIKFLEEYLYKNEEFFVYDRCKEFIDEIEGYNEFIDYYKLIKVGIYTLY